MKIKNLQDLLRKRNIDAALFLNLEFDIIEPNILYFSDYSGIGALVVPKNSSPFLVVPQMEYTKARLSNIPVIKKQKNKRLTEIIIGVMKKRRLRHNTIGIDKSIITLHINSAIKKSFKKAKTKDISKNCLEMRMIKTNEEIEKISKACSISDKILNNLIKNFKKFKKESDARNFLESETKKRGCELAFKPIVASAKHSSMPHSDDDGKIKKGFCVIDFGLKYQGYCSDTTRTIYIGKITQKEKDLYNLLFKTQKTLIENARENIKCDYLYNLALKLLGKYQKNFTHGLGHGVGIKVHELPNLACKSKDKLKNNMVFTIEPGIYLKQFGIRIEDTILLNNEPQILTKIPKDLLVIS